MFIPFLCPGLVEYQIPEGTRWQLLNRISILMFQRYFMFGAEGKKLKANAFDKYSMGVENK